MHRKELNERSPLRVLEHSIHGGLGRGNLGVVAARHGVGKTAFLVGVALDDLIRGRQVLHVSLQQPVERVRTYYDEIFGDLVREHELEDIWRIRVEMERNRRIHCYLGGTFSTGRLADTLGFLKEHGAFTPSVILVDDYPFDAASEETLDDLRKIAGGADAEIWMSAVVHRESDRDGSGIPEPLSRFVSRLDVILRMAHDGRSVHVELLKDHDSPRVPNLRLALDPTTMLLVRR